MMSNVQKLQYKDAAKGHANRATNPKSHGDVNAIPATQDDELRSCDARSTIDMILRGTQ